MIADPWIILRVDRSRLGSRMWAVGRPGGPEDPRRRASGPARAWRFVSRADAEAAALDLAWIYRDLDDLTDRERKEPTVLFVVDRLDEVDLARERPELPPCRQLDLPF